MNKLKQGVVPSEKCKYSAKVWISRQRHFPKTLSSSHQPLGCWSGKLLRWEAELILVYFCSPGSPPGVYKRSLTHLVNRTSPHLPTQVTVIWSACHSKDPYCWSLSMIYYRRPTVNEDPFSMIHTLVTHFNDTWSMNNDIICVVHLLR